MEVTRYDGTTVVCVHDGAPCNGCLTPKKDWPDVWKRGFFLVEQEEEDER